MSLFGNYSKKHIILYSVLGMLFGLGSYMTLTLSSTCLVFPVLLCFLFAKSGFVPVLIAIAAYAAGFTCILGPVAALLMAILLVLPALLVILATAKGTPYFTQLKIGVFGFAGSVVALLLIAGAASGGNLVDSVLEVFRESIEALPTAMQDALLTVLYPDLAGVNATSIPILGNVVREQYLNDFITEMRGTLIDEMLPTLLKSSLVTAFLCSYLTARPLAVRGDIPQNAFQPLSKWAMPGQMCVGLLLTTFAAYLIDMFSGTGSVTTFLTMFTIMECVFTVQGLAAFDRMLCAGKASMLRKVVTLGGMYVLAPSVLSGIGICSAIFGRRGLLINMKNKNHPH